MNSLLDIRAMRRALHLARQGLYSTTSNPRVGCVITNAQGTIIAEGWHKQDGDLHAEAMALKDAKSQAQGATVYVTLEPCSHIGKQPACSDALIEAGVQRIVIATGDPNPLVSGKSIAQFTQANIQVELGLLSKDSIALNPGFHKRMTTNMPWIRVKTALTIDGKIAAADDSSNWITGKQARQDTMHWRGRAQAIITGRTTVEKDNPRLNVRGLSGVNQPKLFVLDSQLRLNKSLYVLQQSNTTLVSCLQADANSYNSQLNHLCMKADNGTVCLPSFARWLAQKGYNEIHVEAGSLLSGSFLQQGLVDELIVYQAPILLGNKGKSAFTFSVKSLTNALHLNRIDQKQLGRDTRFIFQFSRSN